MHNKLRRAIEQEQRASYEAPHEKIAAQSALLSRALVALGGLVDSERPPQETVRTSGVFPVATNVVGSVNPDSNEVFIVGADFGDENDYDLRRALGSAEVDEYVAGLGDIDPK